MKEQLELKHLAPYLPYGLKIYWHGTKDVYGICFNDEIDFKKKLYPLSTLVFTINSDIELFWKPILRPLSDLTKEIEHNGERFTPTVWLRENYSLFGIQLEDMEKLIQMIVFVFNDIKSAPYYIIEKLLEWHFDVFGLIDKGLAISYEEAGL